MSGTTPTERTAHLVGGPHDGETLKSPYMGKELRLPDEEPGGVYVLHSRVTPFTEHDFFYRWELRDDDVA